MFSLLGPFFNENSNLRRLTISGSDGFSGGLRKCSSSLLDALTKFNSLREYDCGGHRIYDICMAPIIRALEGHSGLNKIDLSANMVRGNGMPALAALLTNPLSSVVDLNLQGCNIQNKGAVTLAAALGGNRTLRKLNLANNSRINITGWAAIFAQLQSPQSSLEELSLEGNRITMTGWDDLSDKLCNRSSINATFNSNHTLQRVFMRDVQEIRESRLPSDLKAPLRLNRENTKAEAARRKILQVHFSGDFNTQPFIDMNLKALPRVGAWMARDQYGSSLLYQFLQNTSVLFGVDGGVAKCEDEARSKRRNKKLKRKRRHARQDRDRGKGGPEIPISMRKSPPESQMQMKASKQVAERIQNEKDRALESQPCSRTCPFSFSTRKTLYDSDSSDDWMRVRRKSKKQKPMSKAVPPSATTVKTNHTNKSRMAVEEASEESISPSSGLHGAAGGAARGKVEAVHRNKRGRVRKDFDMRQMLERAKRLCVL